MFFSLTNAAQNPTGNWMRGDGMSKVRVAPCGNDICATNTWIEDPNSSEKVGDVLVMRLKPSGGNVLRGTAYDAQRNLTYSFDMTVNPSQLNTKGCILAKLLCKDVIWNRIP
eukprot:gene7701-7762_t